MSNDTSEVYPPVDSNVTPSEVIPPLALTDSGSMASDETLYKSAENDFSYPDALLKAVRVGNLEEVKKVLRNQLSMNEQNKYDYKKVLVEASAMGNPEIVAELLDSGEKLHDISYHDALSAAVKCSNAEVCSMLLKKSKDVAGVSLMLVKSKDVLSVLLHNNADVNETSDKGWTALHNFHHSEVLTSLLLRCGVDANVKNTYGKTALHLATESGNLEVISLLARTTADVDAQTNYSWGGYTALHIACGALAYPSGSRKTNLISQRTTSRIVLCLLDAGANINLQNARKVTPLGFAARIDDANLFALLLEKGAEFNMNKMLSEIHGINVRRLLHLPTDPISKSDSKTARDLILAARFGQEEELRSIIDSGISVDCRSDTTALEEAVNSGYITIVKYLLDNKADVNAQHNGESPLHVAVHSPKVTVEIVDLLLERGGRIDTKDNFGRLPLHLAAAERQAEFVSLLVSKGSEINAYDNLGFMPLHYAAREGASESVQVLVEHGAEVTARVNFTGWTTLHCAAVGGSVDVVKFLLDKGVSPNVTAMDKWTPLHCCAWLCPLRKHPEEVAAILVEHGANISAIVKEGSTALHLAALHGSPEVVSTLLAKGADIHMKDKLNRTALHCAAWRGLPEIINKLLDKGSDINATSKKNRTPLLWCATNINPEAVSLFLEKGSNPNDKDEDGMTLLHWASRRGISKIVSVLLEKGADVNSRNNARETPLHCAYKGSKYSSHVISLLDDGADLNIDEDADWRGLFEFDRPYKFVICLLLRHGADKLAEEENGCSPVTLVETAKRRVSEPVIVPPALTLNINK